MIDERARRLLFQLNRDTWATVSASALPQSVKSMVYFHISKPWVPDFLAIAISPLKEGLDKFLERAVFGLEGLSFYYPSLEWWKSHAQVSHPPEGTGCDVGKHVEFLSMESPDPEFLYANVLKSGDVLVLGTLDFEDECAFWDAGIRA